MKRTFNYTQRAKITQRSVRVRLYAAQDGAQIFDADLDFSGHKTLPAGTQIYLEAYYRSAMMRFTVGTYDPERPTYALRGQRLDDLQDPIVNFRVKLVDVSERIGRLVGVIERVQVFNEDNKQIERIGLLPVNFGGVLGHQVWKVEVDPDDGPLLHINEALNVDDGALRQFVANDPAFVTLVFPEALRRILEALLADDYDLTDEDSWQYKWARFAASLGAGRPPDGDDQAQALWIDTVVDAFCNQSKVKGLFEALIGERST
ncbi:MAG: hypothetical protein GYB67_08245 [Chloroflexi bacterium]|nr:hypothetical protein [Chloroflexota bacterium]